MNLNTLQWERTLRWQQKLNNTLFFLFFLFLLSLCAVGCFVSSNKEMSVSDSGGYADSLKLPFAQNPVFASAETARTKSGLNTGKLRLVQAAVPSSVILDLNNISVYIFLTFVIFSVLKKFRIIPLGSRAPPYRADKLINR